MKNTTPKPVLYADAIGHLDGCPMERFEEFSSKRPDGEEVTITRCLDCAMQVVDGKSITPVYVTRSQQNASATTQAAL